MNKIKLVIFDMDGVIVDSEPLHRRAKEIIIDRYGLKSSLDLASTVGLPNEDLWALLIKESGVNLKVDELVRLQCDLILEMMIDMRMEPIKGLTELLGFLSKKGIAIGLASSSNRYFVDKVLMLFNLNKWFNYTAAGDEVPMKKPAPDVYQKVLDLAGVRAEEAAAVEDSSAGIKAALASNLKCFAYDNPNSGQQDLKDAYQIVHSLTELESLLW